MNFLAGTAASDEFESILSEEDLNRILKNGLGFDSTLTDMVRNPDRYEEMAIEHLNGLIDGLAQSLEEYTGVDSEDVKEVYEQYIEELREKQGAMGEAYDKALEKVLDIIPDSGISSCE